MNGTVNIGNLPAVQQVAGTVAVTEDPVELRHGQLIIGPPGGVSPREIEVPADVVLTDAMVTRVAGSAENCSVVLFEDRSGTKVSLAQLFPTIQDASRDLHFLSGIRLTADRLGFGVNNDCYVNVLWSGYVEAG